MYKQIQLLSVYDGKSSNVIETTRDTALLILKKCKNGTGRALQKRKQAWYTNI